MAKNECYYIKLGALSLEKKSIWPIENQIEDIANQI